MDDTQIYDDFYEISTDLIEIHGEHYSDNIYSSLLNVILVLTGARTACVIDSIRNNPSLLDELLERLLDYYEISVTRLTSVEYLLYLTVNKDYVEKEYKHNPTDVLGYCYNKNDFANINIDRVTVEFIAKSKLSDYEVGLFITVIPSYAYNKKSIQKCIFDNVNLFNYVLSNLDYTVSVSITHI